MEKAGPAEVLAKALEILGPKGEHWTRAVINDGCGNYCVYGAIEKAAKELGAPYATEKCAKEALAKEILPEANLTNMDQVYKIIWNYNDGWLLVKPPFVYGHRPFEEVKEKMCSTLKNLVEADDTQD